MQSLPDSPTILFDSLFTRLAESIVAIRRSAGISASLVLTSLDVTHVVIYPWQLPCTLQVGNAAMTMKRIPEKKAYAS